MKTIGFLCTNPHYEYKGLRFEYGHFGPAKLLKDGSISKQQGRKFWAIFDEWEKLPDREKYRIGGGCQPIVKEDENENH